ncbi:unnamed protein product [Cunninghamella echinulata]
MNQSCTNLSPIDNVHIRMSEDRLSTFTTTMDGKASIHSTCPNELDKLFKDRYNSSPEDDICFPSTSLSHQNNNTNTNKTNNNNNSNNNNNNNNNNNPVKPILLKGQQQQQQQKINYEALQQFKIQQYNDKDISSYTLNDKKLSLYGDNNNNTQLIDSNTLQFTYYHCHTGRLQGRTLFDLNSTENTIEHLLEKENHWIDITCPTLSEMKAISQIFGIHRLTIEDIMNQEIREKCDSFKNYLFICYRAFVHEENILKPITFYNIVFKDHILTIHFDQVPHVNYVQQRIEQLQEYIVIVPDWINYALIDEITDSFAPLIQQIEQEVEMIDDLILLQTSTNLDQLDMVTRIGICRKRVMQILRLLSCKSDVIKTLMKRFDERLHNYSNNSGVNFLDYSLTSSVESLHPTSTSSSPSPPPPPPPSFHHHHTSSYHHHHHHSSIDDSMPITNSSTISTTPTVTKHNSPFIKNQKSFDSLSQITSNVIPSSSSSSTSPFFPQHKKKVSYSEYLWHQHNDEDNDDRIYPDIGLYFGDVYDHILTLLQNLQHYETVLARTHSNYLARLSIELTRTSNSTNTVIGRLTIFATILLPMNLVTGLWGMNVKVPGMDYDNLIYFFWIVCSLAVFAICSLTLARQIKLF